MIIYILLWHQQYHSYLNIEIVFYFAYSSHSVQLHNKNQILMSRVKTNRSVTQCELLLQQTTQLMQHHKNNGSYIQAQNCRITIQQIKRQKQERIIREMERRHQEERNHLSASKQIQSKELFQIWQKRLNQQATEGQRNLKEIQTKHEVQFEKAREQLELQSPTKVKQSAECLNLRKMQAYMVKQKNYAQAHTVQKQIAEIERFERQKWMGSRNDRISAALKHLRDKQENEVTNLNKNIKAILNESYKIRLRQEEKLNLKFSNLERELMMKQEKEKLAHKGEFTSKGGEGSPLLTKSRLLRSQVL